MQRFPESDAKYAYSPEHTPIGTVQPGEVFEVESVEGYLRLLPQAGGLHARVVCERRGGEVGRRRADHGRRGAMPAAPSQ